MRRSSICPIVKEEQKKEIREDAMFQEIGIENLPELETLIFVKNLK